MILSIVHIVKDEAGNEIEILENILEVFPDGSVSIIPEEISDTL